MYNVTQDRSVRSNRYVISARNFLEMATAVFLSLFLIFSSTTFAQDAAGRIAGTLVDATTGDPLIGANVIIDGQPLGASSDIDGNYLITDVPAGTYTIIVQYVGYADTKITEVVVAAGERTKLDVSVKEEIIEGDEVIVEAKLLENTGASLLKKRQRAGAVSDAVSAEEFSQTGSGDAAEAVKQVVGASVVDGKYVYVRGLGDRYSNTQLNGVELPSSDPDKKAFQLDLLPTNLLDNIVTIKTFTPDKSGSFSGGIVDVGTKNFPEEMTFKVSYGTSMNSQTTFDDNFLTYEGGANDWLGTDDGTRAVPELVSNGSVDPNELPSSVSEVRNNLDGVPSQNSSALGKAFGSVMDVTRSSAPVNQSFGLSTGNQIQVGETSSIGYIGSVTYGRSFSFYEDGEIGIYSRRPGVDDLDPQYLASDSKGSEDASIGALASLAYNITPSQQISGNVFFSRSGTSTTRLQTGVWPEQFDSERILSTRELRYVERDITSFQLRGKHQISPLFGSTLEWSAATSSTSQDEPDRRILSFLTDTSRTPTVYTISSNALGRPSRFFRGLEDNSDNFSIDLTIPFPQWGGLSSQFKIGSAFQQGDRMFSESLFEYIPDNTLFQAAEGNIAEFFSNENFDYFRDENAPGRPLRGNIVTDASNLQNNYEGEQEVFAGYGMIDIPLSSKLRFVGGARYETTKLNAASQDTSLEVGDIDLGDLLPSANFVYSVNPDMNIRVAATRTLARPNFREIAPYSNKDFVGGFTVTGNPELNRTLIENYDLRWEWFAGPGEIFAISGFYKKMEDPIEVTFQEGTTASNLRVTWVNVPEATILGAEFEARLNLGRFAQALTNFTVGGNLSFVNSSVDIAEDELLNRQGIDPDYNETTRDLQGQSPYIVNLDLLYNNYERGTTATLHYNTFGERLARVSRGATPDIFEQPATSLDFVFSQKIGGFLSAKFSVKNILDSEFKEIYPINDTPYFSYKRGTSYSLGLSYSL